MRYSTTFGGEDVNLNILQARTRIQIYANDKCPPDFPPFSFHADGNAGTRWKKCLNRLERLLVALNITDEKRKRALLLHYAGTEVDEICDTLPDTEEEKD